MFYLFGKNWIDSYVHVHFRRSNLLTIVQRLKKYLPSLFLSNKLLSKYEIYISSLEKSQSKRVYIEANVNVISFSKELVTRHESFKTQNLQTETEFSWWHKAVDIKLRWHLGNLLIHVWKTMIPFWTKVIKFHIQFKPWENEFTIESICF